MKLGSEYFVCYLTIPQMGSGDCFSNGFALPDGSVLSTALAQWVSALGYSAQHVHALLT